MDIPFLKGNKAAQERREQDRIFEQERMTSKDIIAPSSVRVAPRHLEIGGRLAKSFFVFSYPRYLNTAWLAPVINLDTPMDVSMFIHPIDTGQILKQLRRRVTEIQSELVEREEKGLVRSPELETAYQDLEELRDRLQTAQEKMFNFSLYITPYGETESVIREIETTLRSMLESKLIYIKPALYQQRDGFNSSLPYGKDFLGVHNKLNTEPLSAVFPFISSDLSSNEGVLYGINRHNNSLILFDRFSLPNANEVVFATSGAGKSYAIKVEILRYLMTGVDAIILDPENEYEKLANTVGGSFFKISLSSDNHINPFDLPMPREDENPADVLRSNVINLVGLMRIMFGGLSNEEDSVLDTAITETYAAKDITPNSDPATWQEKTPIMQDLQEVLETMDGAESLVTRLRRFTEGTYSNFFNQHSNLSLDKGLVVFGIRDMESELRPMAMYIIMRYIWNMVRSDLKKRIFVLDEAWWLMQTEDGASFLYGLAKRARKYWLAVTTITQDVEDFMKSPYGKPILSNASLALLMKESPAAIDVVQKVFNLTSEERALLLQNNVGEGIFVAGKKRVSIQVVASPIEHQIITTDPKDKNSSIDEAM